MTDFTRRGFLGTAALAAGAMGIEVAQADDDPKSYKHKEDLEELPTFRYAMEEGHARVTEGGSAREATIKQLPISRGLAGVSMQLKPGGIRELHWHAIAAEWAFVVKGRVRTTVIGPEGVSETNDFNPGDVWYFPRGHGHMLQNIGDEECHFILIFDDGAFSEFGTFSSTDWLGHTPPHVLAKSLGVSASAFARFPKEELYIVKGRKPPKDIPPNHAKKQKLAPHTHRYPLMDQEPYETFRGGTERRVTVNEFPISTTMSGVVLDLDPGAVREPHWHPNADEWQYIVSGHCRIGVFGSSGRARVEEFHQGDAGYVPRGYGHYIENADDRNPLRVLVGFNHGRYEEISLSTWLAANPDDILADNFKTSDDLAGRLPDHRVFIASKDGP